jgi:hypothetical protein
MKALAALIFIMTATQTKAGDPAPFSGEPFRLQYEGTASSEIPILPEGNVRLSPGGALGSDFGKSAIVVDPTRARVRVDYGEVLCARAFENFPRYHFLDAPGPAYNEQRAKAPSDERPSGNPA